MLDASKFDVALDDIHVIPGFNPRRYFDAAKLASLTASVRQHGVIQPITLRPNPEGPGYALVAGERRYRAAREAGLATIPAVIRPYTDAQALAVAGIENHEREDISVAEEAHIGRRAVDAVGGDKEEACRLLGWSTSKLEARLLLLNAETFVLEAVAEKRIKLGHAELLSTLTPELQRSVYDKLVAHHVSVETLRAQLATFTQDLRAAPFAIDGCRGCPHNSATQASLFEFHVGEGRCANRACWDQKTEVYLVDRKASLAQEYNVVWFDREKDPATYMPVRADGADGVGLEQFDTGCKGCVSFGAVIATAPGKQGHVSAPLCFDRACHAEKRAVWKAAQPEPAQAGIEIADASAAGRSGKKKPVVKQRQGKKPAPHTSNPGSPVKVTRHIHRALRQLAAQHAAGHARIQQVLAVYALRELLSAHDGGTVSERSKKVFALDDAALAAEQLRLTTRLLGEFKGRGEFEESTTGYNSLAARALKEIGFDLAGAVAIDKAFMEAHTKSGLEALLVSAGFAQSLPGDDESVKERAFKRLVSGKNSEIMDAVLAARHDFSRFIPDAVASAFKNLTEKS